MAILIAVTGLAGVGKTTALKYLRDAGVGEIVYLGETVLRTVHEKGLPKARESERIVRLELREQLGPAALAILKADEVQNLLEKDVNVLIDAIFALPEFHALRERASPSRAHLLAITAPFAIRCARLSVRACRPFNEDELRERDGTEEGILGIGGALAAAGHRIVNDGPQAEFFAEIDRYIGEIGKSSMDKH